ncbi:MAG: TIGR01244 family sulfur transferase [Mangrovicoccus sp.]|nr:TIGR01244 family sulfur transferase [Mangrovicoccus sp.]
MTIKPLSPDYAVSAQITPQDIDAIKDAGYVAVMCNRPDPENPAPLYAKELREAAEAAGLKFYENPVMPGALTMNNLKTQQAAMADAGGPLLAYCASGNRSAMVWSLIIAQSGSLSPDQILAITTKMGYDHSALRMDLEMMAKRAAG